MRSIACWLLRRSVRACRTLLYKVRGSRLLTNEAPDAAFLETDNYIGGRRRALLLVPRTQRSSEDQRLDSDSACKQDPSGSTGFTGSHQRDRLRRCVRGRSARYEHCVRASRDCPARSE